MLRVTEIVSSLNFGKNNLFYFDKLFLLNYLMVADPFVVGRIVYKFLRSNIC